MMPKYAHVVNGRINTVYYERPETPGTVEVPDTVFAGFEWSGQAWTEPSAPAPSPHIPDAISRRQFSQGLALQGRITEAEALAWVGVGEIPAAFLSILAEMTPTDRFAAKMLLAGATEFRRSHPLVSTVGAAQGWTDAQIDDFWRYCGGL